MSPWQRDGLPISDALDAHLRALYAVPARAYHNTTHVDEVLERFDEARRDVGFQDERSVFYALLFHDAVYVAGAKDNEKKSAQAMTDLGLDLPKARDIILATAQHGRLAPSDVDLDTALALDCDMAILGSAPERFARYDRQIAEEYSGIITSILYRVGRARFLDGLLKKPRIYLSDYFHARFDRQARANLARARAAE